MNYPLISEYVEAIKLAQDNLDKLSYLRPVLSDEGLPIMSNGNFATVFKMKDERDGKYYALKCFIKEQEGRDEAYKLIADELEPVSSDFITPIKYLEKELFVDTTSSDVSEFPVLLMDWVEGVTLDRYIRDNLNNQYKLRLITFRFCRLAAWLMAQSFAHGDLKPDNIMVKADGSLVLVDYDGMYVPAMKSQKAREIGSPDYRHPARTIDDFNEHIDDFSLATIAMQMYAIALQPSLLSAAKGDTLLLTEADYRNIDKSKIMSQLYTLVNDTDFSRLLDLFYNAFSEISISNISQTFIIRKPIKPIKPIITHLSTKVTHEDIANGIKDKFGVLYSPDGKRLLRGGFNTTYCVKPGTLVICDNAFEWCENIASVSIPDSVTDIGRNTFSGCRNLISVIIPDSVAHIGDGAFAWCNKLTCITISDSVTDISNYAFYECKELTSISIPNTVTNIGDGAFYGCENIASITIPDSVTNIGEKAFYGCIKLTSINIPDSVTFLGKEALCECKNLVSITIPDSVTHIGDGAFSCCHGLSRIHVSCENKVYDSRGDSNAVIQTSKNTLIAGCKNTVIPDTVTHIGKWAFRGCENLININVPNSVKFIGDGAFYGCENIASISIPDSVTNIGEKAFYFCRKLPSISIPSSVTHIGNYAFLGCYNLSRIQVSCENKVYDSRGDSNAVIQTATNSLILGCKNTVIPNSVTHIGDNAFYFCSSLASINIPDSVTHIGNYAFDSCSSLASINIPDSVTHIGDGAFYFCGDIASISIPGSVTHIGDNAFYGCINLVEIHIPAYRYYKFKKRLPGLESKFIKDFKFIKWLCYLKKIKLRWL